MQDAATRSYETLGERIVWAARFAMMAHLGRRMKADGSANDQGITGAEGPEDPDLGLDLGRVGRCDPKWKNHPRRWAAGGAGQDGEGPKDGTVSVLKKQPSPPTYAEGRAG